MDDIPETGSAFVCGKSQFDAEKFHVKNDRIMEISCGDEHTGVVTETGRVFMFGANSWGQLGLGHEATVKKPSCIKSLKEDPIMLIACGRYHTIVASKSGKLYSFGCNSESQLGLGENANESFYNTPQRIKSLSSNNWRMLSAGSGHSCALSETGELYVWGINDNYELGIPSIKEQRTPIRVDLNFRVVFVSCGYYHTAIITKKGQLLLTGSNEYGQLGYQTQKSKTFQPVEDLDHEAVDLVACGGAHTVCLTANGQVYVFGDGAKGQLGLGTEYQRVDRPHLLKFFDQQHQKSKYSSSSSSSSSSNHNRIALISAGECHTVFVTSKGRLYATGDNRYGKLGLNQNKYPSIQFVPRSVRKYRGLKVLDVACGGCHMILLAKTDPNYRPSDDDEQMSSETEMSKTKRSSFRSSNSNTMRRSYGGDDDYDDDPLKFRSSKLVTTIGGGSTSSYNNRGGGGNRASDSDSDASRTFNRTHTLTKDNKFVPLENTRVGSSSLRTSELKKYSSYNNDYADVYENNNNGSSRYSNVPNSQSSRLSASGGGGYRSRDSYENNAHNDDYNYSSSGYNKYGGSSGGGGGGSKLRNSRNFSDDDDDDNSDGNNRFDRLKSGGGGNRFLKQQQQQRDSYGRYGGAASTKPTYRVTTLSDEEEEERNNNRNRPKSSSTNFQVTEYVPPSRRNNNNNAYSDSSNRGGGGNLTNRSTAGSETASEKKKPRICTIL